MNEPGRSAPSPSNPTNVTLIGMPASGKSTIGRLLAQRLSLRYLDLDHHIEEVHGEALNVLLTRHGHDGFLDLESRAVLDLPDDLSRTVLAPGGSVVYREASMERLNAVSTVVHLDVPLEEIQARIGSLQARGVVLRPGQSLADLYEERSGLYRRHATVRVDCSGLNAEAVTDRVVDCLGGASAG